MPEPVRLSPRDYDPWELATPLQLLHFIQKLGVTSRVIARWLGVTPAAISMWANAKRPIPLGYAPALRVWARHAMDEAWKANTKEVSLQPTDALQRAVRSELTSLYDRWKLEVLFTAGTLRQELTQQYEALGILVRHPTLTPERRETMALMMETMLVKVDVILTLQQDQPASEEELIARLTAAHAQTPPLQLSAEERAAAEADQPEAP